MLLPAPLPPHKLTRGYDCQQTLGQVIGLIITIKKQLNQLDFYIFGSQHNAIVF